MLCILKDTMDRTLIKLVCSLLLLALFGTVPAAALPSGKDPGNNLQAGGQGQSLSPRDSKATCDDSCKECRANADEMCSHGNWWDNFWCDFRERTKCSWGPCIICGPLGNCCSGGCFLFFFKTSLIDHQRNRTHRECFRQRGGITPAMREKDFQLPKRAGTIVTGCGRVGRTWLLYRPGWAGRLVGDCAGEGSDLRHTLNPAGNGKYEILKKSSGLPSREGTPPFPIGGTVGPVA